MATDIGVLDRNAAPAKENPGASSEKPAINRARESDLAVGGSRSKEIVFSDSETPKKIGNVLRSRQESIRNLARPESELSVVERFVQGLTPEQLARIEQGEMTRGEMGIALTAINDEIVLKAAQIGKSIEDTPTLKTSRISKGLMGLIPFVSKNVGKIEVETEFTGATKISSDYAKKEGEEDLEKQILGLHGLQIEIARNFFGKGLEQTMIDPDGYAKSMHPLLDHEAQGTALQRLIRNGLEDVLSQRHGGISYADLQKKDPKLAFGALQEARGRALAIFAEDSAKELLQKEKPEIDKETIEERAKEAEAPPKQEDISKIQETAEAAKREFEEAERRFKETNDPLEQTRKALEQSQKNLERVRKDQEILESRFEEEIKLLEAQINTIQAKIPPLNPQASNEEIIASQQALSIIIPLINKFYERQYSLVDKKNKLYVDTATAEQDQLEKQGKLQEAEKQANANNLEDLRKGMGDKKTAKEEAEQKLKEAKSKKEGVVSEESKEKAQALRTWIKPVEGYQTIVDAVFSTRQDEFSREKLGDPTPKEETFEGTERIREHIFYLVDKKGYNASLARKMLPDQTITDAIVKIFRLPKDTPTNTAIASLKTANRFQIGDTLRYLIHEGVKRAERGNPYLEP